MTLPKKEQKSYLEIFPRADGFAIVAEKQYAGELAALFRAHEVERTYLCVAHGRVRDRRLESMLVTDRELVQQVLGNLIDNACKYSRGAEDRRLWLRASSDGSRVVFEIEDRGPGVPEKDCRLIFRAFRRGRGADETAGGVGLGLALARRWTHLLGGRLTLQRCAAGCGACFRVELPV